MSSDPEYMPPWDSMLFFNKSRSFLSLDQSKILFREIVEMSEKPFLSLGFPFRGSRRVRKFFQTNQVKACHSVIFQLSHTTLVIKRTKIITHNPKPGRTFWR